MPMSTSSERLISPIPSALILSGRRDRLTGRDCRTTPLFIGVLTNYDLSPGNNREGRGRAAYVDVLRAGSPNASPIRSTDSERSNHDNDRKR
jgi:hypothetical protein